MYVFTMPAENWNELEPNREAIFQLIQKHYSHRPKMHKLMDYYEGRHEILEDQEKRNKLVCNHAKDITDTATAYFLGNPITYKSQDTDLSLLTDELDGAGADEADGDNALDLSIYGHAYDYIYTKKDDTSLMIKNLSAENTFMVYDDSIEQNELFSVYYYEKKDDSDQTGNLRYIATVITENYKWVFELCGRPISNDTSATGELESSRDIEGPEPHFKGEIPITEWYNNKLAIGDYELQIPLIDAYNALMSDRVTDKEQFIDSILAIYGTLLADEDGEEEGDEKGINEALKKLHTRRVLEMPDGSKAEYLTATFDEAGVELLRKAIEEDIHKFSHIPCLTDDSFAGNVSGVAMEFKLLGIENITKIKTRYYRKGLRKRIRIFCNWIRQRQNAFIDPKLVQANFTRALPKNLLELSQMVANLQGTVSRKTLLSQIPFVTDVDEELRMVEEENEEAAQRQRELFSMEPNEAPEENDEENNSEEEEDENDLNEKQ